MGLEIYQYTTADTYVLVCESGDVSTVNADVFVC